MVSKFASIERRLEKLENEGSLQAMQKLLDDAKLEMNAVLVRNGKIAKQRIAEATERHELVRKQLDDYVQKTSVSSWDLLQRTTAAMAELQALDGRMTKEMEDLIVRAEALNASLENLPTAGKFQAVANDVTSLQKKVSKLEHAGAASPSNRSSLVPHRPERRRSSERSSTSTTPQTLGGLEEHTGIACVSTAGFLPWRHKVESELERLSDEVSNLAVGVVRENWADGDESVDREVEIRQASASLRRRGRSTGAEARLARNLARNASCPAPSYPMMWVPAGPDGRVSTQDAVTAAANMANLQFTAAPFVCVPPQ
jgi:hypothetical protein